MEKEYKIRLLLLIIITSLVVQSFITGVKGENIDKFVASTSLTSNLASVKDESQLPSSFIVSSQEKSFLIDNDELISLRNSDETQKIDQIEDSSMALHVSIKNFKQLFSSSANTQKRLFDLVRSLKDLWNLLKDKNNTSPSTDDTNSDAGRNDTTDHIKDPTDSSNDQPTIASLANADEPITPSSYVYPRLSLGTFWLQDWLNKPGYGLAWLYQFQLIYTQTLTQEVYNVQHAAIVDGRYDWVRNTTFINMFCFYDATDQWSQSNPPPDWKLEHAANSPDSAIDIAIYENKLLGCDWFMRDTSGNKIWLWAEGQSWAIDTTPDCPQGLWDGRYTVNGHQYYLGDTRGLTFAEWVTTNFKETVIYNSLFAQVYDGIQSEDYTTAWLYTFRGQIPDPKRDGTGMNYNELTAYCRDTWNMITTDFWGDLVQHGFITRLNGNGLRWRGEDYTNDWPAWQESFSGCKFEDAFKWGGWPNWDMPMWWNIYGWVEQYYHPLTNNPNDQDERQGWDVTTIQVNARNSWDNTTRQKWKRMGLAYTLMGDGYADCYASQDDYFFCFFLRHGHNEYAPEGIPEMQFTLGQALGEYHMYSYYPMYPLYYRQFFNNETQKTYAVVLNIWNFQISNIPAKDGVWFEGDWPQGEYTQIIFG
ncbi:MAG: hypothetical protein V1726_03865 [Methanobacteriota archaeon]